ncbi:MAG: SulP family inorganic anion transporter, partial [Myxococcota bacterium]|nr:SulP family inorganic anion transporter [Myxococcota bacterium]
MLSPATSVHRMDALRADLTAALTVTLVGIPQCLAYAMMSGLPPAYGLVTAAVPGVVAA